MVGWEHQSSKKDQGPAPMDIGALYGGKDGYKGYKGGKKGKDSKGRHEGDGKGGKKGKKGKNSQKGLAKGKDGKNSQPFNGYCANWGKWGHTAAQCWSLPVNAMQADTS
eukprot:2511561-Alexandrium_andersonii.AAC.1